MALTKAGAVFTLTGANADTSAFSSNSDVTSIQSGNYVVHYLGDNQLKITGSLTIDPTKEKIVFGSTASYKTLQVPVTGTLTLGKKKTVNGIDVYTYGDAIVFTRDDTNNFFSENFCALFVDGGTINAYGGTIKGGLLNVITNGARGTIEDLTFYNNSTRNAKQIRFKQGTANNFNNLFVKKLTLDGSTFATKAFFEVNPAEYSFIYKNGSFQSWASGGQTFIFESFDFSQNIAEFDHEAFSVDPNTDTIVYYDNSSSGSAIRVDGSSDTAEEVFFSRQDVQFNVSDLSGNSIANCVVDFIDYDDGNRVNPTDHNLNIPATRIYHQSTNASGTTTFNKVWTATQTMRDKTKDETDISYRSKYADDQDKYDCFFCHYNYNIAQTEATFKGLGGTVVPWTLFEDTLITEPSKLTALGYTTIPDAYKFYDRSKADLVDNYLRETETPVTRVDGALDTRALNINVKTTGSAYALTSSTVSIKTTNYTGGLKTTGNIAIASGINIDGCQFSGDTTTQGVTAVNNTSATKLILEGTSGTINFTDCPITELVNNSGNDLLINKVGGSIGTKIETSGRFFATIENGVIDCGSYDVVYDTSASEYASISGNVVTINSLTNQIVTTGTLTIAAGSTYNEDFDGTVIDLTGRSVYNETQTITRLVLAAPLNSDPLEISGSGANISEIENTTGIDYKVQITDGATTPSLIETSGALSLTSPLTFAAFDGEPTVAVIYDTVAGEFIYPPDGVLEAKATHVIDASGRTNLNISLGRETFYVKTTSVDASQVNESIVVLDAVQNLEGTNIDELADSMTLSMDSTGGVPAEIIHATFNSNPGLLTQDQMRELFALLHIRQPFIAGLCKYGLSGNDTFETTPYGLNFKVPVFQMRTAGTFDVTTLAYVDDSEAKAWMNGISPNYEWNPRNDAGFYVVPSQAQLLMQQNIGVSSGSSGGLTEEGLHAALDTYSNKAAFKADAAPTASEIAQAVESALMNEADGRALLEAIKDKIANENISEASLVMAIISEVERTGGMLDSLAASEAITAQDIWGHTLEDDETATDMMRLLRAALVGVGGRVDDSNHVYLSKDGNTPRITAETDSQGNRSSVSVDAA